MKRGLKAQVSARPIKSPDFLVATYAPMKRGLKGSDGLFAGLQAVATYAMKSERTRRAMKSAPVE